MLIPFTQYLRPAGRQQQGGFDRPDEIALLAKTIIAEGYNFTCEVFTTGECSLTISSEDQDMMTRVVENGPQVLDAIDDMIREFCARLSASRDPQTPAGFEPT